MGKLRNQIALTFMTADAQEQAYLSLLVLSLTADLAIIISN